MPLSDPTTPPTRPTPPAPTRAPAWKTGDLVRAAIAVLAVYAILRVLLFAHALVFLTFLGVLFGLAVSAGADQLQRFKIPRAAGAPLVVVATIAVLVGFGTWTGPTIKRQYVELRQKLPQAAVKVDQWIASREGGLVGTILNQGDQGGDSAKTKTTARQQPDTIAKTDSIQPDSLSHIRSLTSGISSSVSAGMSRFVFPVITSTFAAVSGIILMLFIAIYIGVEPTMYRNGILALIPKPHRPRWEEVLAASAVALRKWLVAQLLAMIAIGVVTTGALLLLGVPAAFPLGILAGLLEFVPTIGPTLSAVPAIAVAFVDSPEKALAVAGAYVLIQFLENHLLIPLLMKEGVDLPPVLTVLTQAAMALVFGFIGLFIAVPLLVLATVIVKKIYIEDTLGDTGNATVLTTRRKKR